MVCQNCGAEIGIKSTKKVDILGVTNVVLQIRCLDCNALLYGYCRPEQQE